MNPTKFHIPGVPNGPCPAGLEDVVDGLKCPEALTVGITCTASGEWALIVTVRKGTEIPISALTNLEFPVIYELESDKPNMAQNLQQPQ